MTARRPPLIPLRARHLGPLAPVLAGLLTACTVGPDFAAPAAPAVANYRATPEADATVAAIVSADPGAGAAQRFLRDRDIPAEWWQLFESPALDALVRQALSDSPRLAQAEAKLAQAQAAFEARSGSTRLPAVDLNASANRIGLESDDLRSPLPGDEFPFTVASASVGVSYSLDLFGRNRRELEALSARIDYEQFELEAARLALAGNVVTTAIEEASLRHQIETIETAIELQARQLGIVEQLEQLGAVPALDVLRLRGELAGTRATLPGLRQQLEQTRHRLAIYTGQPPGAAELPEFRFRDDLRLPVELPLSLPSDLARQRPDIRAAEALLHEASARLGVAEANFYPQFMLSATAGGVSIPPLINGTAGFALLAASIAQPLFRGGVLRAEQESAEAAFTQAGAAYQEVVLAALQSVADVLVALDAGAKRLSERADAARLAQESFEIAEMQYQAGAVSLLSLLDAERQLVATALDETLAISDRYTGTATLFQALGGGWWNTGDGAP